MSSLIPLKLHYHGPTPNPWKVALVLEELDIPYTLVVTPLTEIKKEPYVSLNPNGRLPALVDPNNNDITLWESGAIIDYLIDVYDKDAKLHYQSSPEKYVTRCWEHFQMSGQGPYFGQKAWFSMFHPEKFPSAIERYLNEIKRVIGVVDSHLKQGTDYLVGNKVTYADLMFIPWFTFMMGVTAPEIDTSEWKFYSAWIERLTARPKVASVLARVHEAQVKLQQERAAQAQE